MVRVTMMKSADLICSKRDPVIFPIDGVSLDMKIKIRCLESEGWNNARWLGGPGSGLVLTIVSNAERHVAEQLGLSINIVDIQVMKF